MYLDIHALQTIPPANINRDDTGAPKSVQFGGVRRVAVSSQAWKRAMRRDFENHLDLQELGERTKFAVDRITEQIVALEPSLADKAEKLASDALKTVKIKVEAPKRKKDEEEEQSPVTGYLLFLARRQIKRLAELVVEAEQAGKKVSAKQVSEALKANEAIDIALFGRMVAENPELNTDACCQVAFATSVHPGEFEFDYFTAVDDNAPKDNAGAGMIGTTEFASSTLYRYANINVDQLIDTLGDQEAAARAVEAAIRAFVTSMPTGKQNTFANRTRPDFVMVSVREDQPVNFIGAFEDAITSHQGRMEEATTRLAEFAIDQDQVFGTKPKESYFVATKVAETPQNTQSLSELAQRVDFAELVAAAGAAARAVQKDM